MVALTIFVGAGQSREGRLDYKQVFLHVLIGEYHLNDRLIESIQMVLEVVILLFVTRFSDLLEQNSECLQVINKGLQLG